MIITAIIIGSGMTNEAINPSLDVSDFGMPG